MDRSLTISLGYVFIIGCLNQSTRVLSSGFGSPNLLFLSPGSKVLPTVLWMSETVVVAMVMPHCNILLQPACWCLQQLLSVEKPTEKGGEGSKDRTVVEGSATGSTRMLIILSRWFVLYYAGDNAQDNNRGRLSVHKHKQACVQEHIHAWLSTYIPYTNIQDKTFPRLGSYMNHYIYIAGQKKHK